jgi:FkbM family methyltransferase
MVRSWGAYEAWIGIWYLGYVVLRILLRVLIGRRRRNFVQKKLRLHYMRARDVLSYLICGVCVDEPFVVRVVKNALKSGLVFIDIGAYTGYYSSLAFDILGVGSKIVAVEPFPPNYEALKRRLMGDGVYILDKAVWVQDDEEVEFRVGNLGDDGLSTTGSITPTDWCLRLGFLTDRTIYVKSIRVDTLIRQLGFQKVDLLKMDIEGAEYPVLIDPNLDLSRVENMVVEVHYRYGGRESREIMQALAQHGFKIVPLYPDQNSNRFHLLACRGEIPW